MEKFRYAPGKPGFGSKGDDGTAGLQGLSMYFTNLDAQTSKITIQASIVNNYVLWTYPGSNMSLRDGRTYVVGDVFIDTEGRAYRITDTSTGEFELLQGGLNTAGYFTSANVQSDNGFNRYFNNNTSPKYIIDNVYSDGLSPYYTIPDNIYGIQPRDYARIEYSNVILNQYNPFTLYSSGSTDANAIAIVRGSSDNIFHIGNLSNTGALRNVGLTFDVASLRSTRDTGSYFTVTSPAGTILTNYEINANSLFDGVFTLSPLSFGANFSSTDISIYWNLNDFTPDTNVTADLYVYKDVSVNTYTFNLAGDASNLRPYVFHNLNSSGYVNLSGLTENEKFKYYISFFKNGWERRSGIQNVATTPTPNLWVIPATTREGSSNHYAKFCVSSNVEWSAERIITENPGTFMQDISTDYSFGANDVSMWIDLTENTDCSSRTGRIRVFSIIPGGNSPVYATITQNGQCVPVAVSLVKDASTDTSYALHINKTANLSSALSDLPADSVVDISVNYTFTVWNRFNSLNYHLNYNHIVQASAPGKSTQTSIPFNSELPPYDRCPVGESRTFSGTLTLLDVDITNIPITIYLSNRAWFEESYMDMYRFESDIYVDVVVSPAKSGTPTYSEHLNNFIQFTAEQMQI
jgi:hypothetical protein